MLKLTHEPLSIDAVFELVADPGAGGVVLFIGTVREQTDGKSVTALEYESFKPMAEKQIEEIEKQINAKWDVRKICVVHRLGRLLVGDKSIIIGVSAPHRREAFEASRYMIEQIKKDVPIWKKEFFEDGEVWVDAAGGDSEGEESDGKNVGSLKRAEEVTHDPHTGRKMGLM